MILVTHTAHLALEQETFVFATSARLERDNTVVLRDPLQRVVARFDPRHVVAIFKREGPNGPRVPYPLIDAEETRPAPFLGLDGGAA